MNLARWEEIKPLLDQVLDLLPEKREAFLAENCGEDAELRAELEAYLLLEGQVDDFEQPLFDLIAGRPPEYRAGERLDRYVLERELARGGMGVVYLGQRIDGEFEKAVVVKVMRKGFDTGDFIRRFHNERQILADLEHPNIARLLDGGTTRDGLPFLVMERIEGRRLDDWVREERPMVEKALHLFLEICGAIHAAHQRLVVHCDLKPSNILVTPDERSKVLDFGIAKVLRQDADGGTRSLVHRLGSPRYASPEQIAGEAISTSTDVFSLGCLLFFLLTGKPPRARSDEAVLPEIPSQAVQSSFASSAGADGEAIRRRRRRLRGDLDAIISKAMAWQPADRYSSAGALADDIQCHLENLPVSAQSLTWSYFLRRFLRRHRQQVVFGVSLLLLAVVALVVLRGFYWQSRIQESRAMGMRDAYLEMLEVYDPTADESRAEAARSAVEEILRNESFRDDRDRALIYDRMGRLFYRLEFLDEALQLHERALALRRQTSESNLADQAASLNNLALVARKVGDLERASALYEESLMLHDRMEGDSEPEKLDILLNLAAVRAELGHRDEAEKLYRETLEKRRSLFGPRSMQVARSLNNLGDLLFRMGRLDEAESLFRQSLALRSEILGPDHPKVLTAAMNLAAVLEALGATSESIELYRSVVEQRRQAFGEEHPTTARAKSSLAYALLGRSTSTDLEAARALLEDALAVYGAEYGLTNEATRIIQRNLAATLLAQGDVTRAEMVIRQVLDASDDWRQRGSWRFADVRSLLGACLLERGDIQTARPFLYESWIPIAEQRGQNSRPAREARSRWDAYLARIGDSPS